jgi:hypothetical protein
MVGMAEWSFLTRHAHAMLFLVRRPDARLRDIAGALDVTERTAQQIVRDLADAGYVVKEREGRRNRYHIQHDLPLREPVGRKAAVGSLLHVLTDVDQTPG